MARDLLVPVVLVLAFASPLAASTDVAIAISGRCAANSQILQTAMTETVRIWSSAGVRVRWVAPEDLPYRSGGEDNWLVVQCSADRVGVMSESRVVPIAAIRFVDARPTHTVVLSIANARMLLGRDAQESRLLGERFPVLRDRRLGRMIGRAIAHEIGHFLSASGAHTRTGLMRATHPVGDLIGESLYPFRIDTLTQ